MKLQRIFFWSFVFSAVISISCFASSESNKQEPGFSKENVKALKSDTMFTQNDTSAIENNDEILNKVVVYYFHGTRRCAKCRKMEAYSKDALEKAFSKELNESKLEWYAINTDKKENSFYEFQYQLYVNSLIISKIENGIEVEWKNLDKIWQLVRKKDEFLKYVQSEVKNFLEKDLEKK